ncbi:type II toxin-antitoxin system RelE/ParE family toxin [[Ruminococcus] lactaris]|uniref:type II toxin-antitoxin system RelE/ParE family toxin n=1 Tax=[Ruminococcus] lactaris TaxID=46228 RepID=UPI00241CD251|nr:type II toxin-antitoxin system RelE/ParE family toxin [[Ruminococcus] lactaris]
MELYYTPRARNDLANIKESVIEKFDDENLAIEVLKKITKTVRHLIVFPYLGQEVSEITGIYTEYRCLFCEKNYVFYRVEADRICVIRVLNEKQDYMRILFGVSETEEI